MQKKGSTEAMLGPFLKLVLTLAEQRVHAENQASSRAASGAPLSVEALTSAMETIAYQPPFVRKEPITLGPFLTMVLTQAERKAAERRFSLHSAAVPNSLAGAVLTGGR